MQCATQAQENFGEHDALELTDKPDNLNTFNTNASNQEDSIQQADKTTQNCISVERSEKALAQKYNGSVKTRSNQTAIS